MVRFAWTAATSFSDLPLQMSLYVGVLGILLSVEEAARALLAFSLGWYLVSGWTSLMIINCFVGSTILLCIGIMGDYIGKIYIEAKDRPIYLVARQYGFDSSPSKDQEPAA